MDIPRCEVCAMPLVMNDRGQPRRTCSDACRQKLHRERVKRRSAELSRDVERAVELLRSMRAANALTPDD